jgi:hypothetical protein
LGGALAASALSTLTSNINTELGGIFGCDLAP